MYYSLPAALVAVLLPGGAAPVQGCPSCIALEPVVSLDSDAPGTSTYQSVGLTADGSWVVSHLGNEPLLMYFSNDGNPSGSPSRGHSAASTWWLFSWNPYRGSLSATSGASLFTVDAPDEIALAGRLQIQPLPGFAELPDGRKVVNRFVEVATRDEGVTVSLLNREGRFEAPLMFGDEDIPMYLRGDARGWIVALQARGDALIRLPITDVTADTDTIYLGFPAELRDRLKSVAPNEVDGAVHVGFAHGDGYSIVTTWIRVRELDATGGLNIATEDYSADFDTVITVFNDDGSLLASVRSDSALHMVEGPGHYFASATRGADSRRVTTVVFRLAGLAETLSRR